MRLSFHWRLGQQTFIIESTNEQGFEAVFISIINSCPLILIIGSAGRVKIQPDRLIHAGVSE